MTFKYHYNKLKIIGLSLLITFYFTFCKKKDISDLPPETLIINNYIYDITTDYYLWEDKIPAGIDVNNYPDPNELFESMMYRSLDRWSFVTDNYQEIIDALNGTGKTPGYQVQFYKYPTGNNVFAIVQYVYSGSPAESVGIQRGDVFIKINGQTITIDNYTDVLYSNQLVLGYGELVDDQIVDIGESLTITSVVMTINPVLQYNVIDTAGVKIGYLLYDQFIENFVPELKSALSSLQSQGINELVLDLRFNPGGFISTCVNLASMLAPTIAHGDVFAYFQWNTLLTNYFLTNEGSQSENLVLPFSAPDISLNLNKLIVLTSGKSASASEALVNGLRPYMDVTLIGDTTSGKYTAANFFYEEQASHTWGIYLVTSKLANKNGVTDFVNGFAPDFYVKDDHKTPLGDAEEPLFGKAIEILTGITAKGAHDKVFPYRLMPEHNAKRNLGNGVLINDNF